MSLVFYVWMLAVLMTSTLVSAQLHASYVDPPTAPAANTTLYVSTTDGSDVGNCTVDAPCASVARAISISPTLVPIGGFALLLLSPGEYGPSSCGLTTVVSTIISGSGAVINCNSTNRFLTSAYGLSLFVSGLTVVNGQAYGNGGGVQVKWGYVGSTVVFDSCTFVNCTSLGSNDGGAVSLEGGKNCSGDYAWFTNCHFRDNHATYYGGAVAFALFGNSVVNTGFFFSNCTFEDNISGEL